MAESNSQATRCPCGFFGSAQTLGLCSKCYNEREQSRALLAVDATRPSSSSSDLQRVIDRESTAVQTDAVVLSSSLNDSTSLCLPTTSASSPVVITANLNPASSERTFGVDELVHPADRGGRVRSDRAELSVISCDDSNHRGTKRKFDDIASGKGDGEGQGPEDPPPQKNKTRCFACKCRLELAVREIGKCQCGHVFCALHRLPEQHACPFDHKEHGRAEARTKMITFRKHIGTSLKRIDADPS